MRSCPRCKIVSQQAFAAASAAKGESKTRWPQKGWQRQFSGSHIPLLGRRHMQMLAGGRVMRSADPHMEVCVRKFHRCRRLMTEPPTSKTKGNNPKGNQRARTPKITLNAHLGRSSAASRSPRANMFPGPLRTDGESCDALSL